MAKTKIVKKASDITDENILRDFKDIMVGLGYDVSQDINKQFLQRIKDKYGVILH